MIRHCMIEWPKREIRSDHIYWPRYGSSERWICQALNTFINMKEPYYPKESEYAACWKGEIRNWGVKVFKISETVEKEQVEKKKEKTWNPLDSLPPLYPTVPADPAAPVVPIPIASPASTTSPVPVSSTTSTASSIPATTPTSNLTAEPSGSPVSCPTDEGPYKNTRGKMAHRLGSNVGDRKDQEVGLFPLWEVPMGGAQGGVGFVNDSLTSSEVRNFKREIKEQLEDPMGLAEQFDQFLGPNFYMWEELNSIMKILLSPEERQMIGVARMRIWERENQQGPLGEYKMPMASPNWNPNDEMG
ncbi:uncharacterized protein LOC109143585 [Corvus cornix cornix]|uniref:uncharacterized protein LOC109143585 n=1 Tax=Corvus cornix cornix TaxID=932674 RepID=UPI000900EAE6|nr:uncharacterized protein LOC109143585 [Corvus cornix cornix]